MSIIDDITKRVKDLPTLSAVATRLMQIISDENHSMKDVVRIVEIDSTLTTKVLRIANSAFYFRGQPITTLPRAIMHLGENMVSGIAIGSCSFIYDKTLTGYESTAGELWDHSLNSAIASRLIATKASLKISPDLAFTAGLLHDIGKAVISEFLEGNAEKMTNWCDKREVEDYISAEKDVLGMDHAEVGYFVAQHWKLPPPLCASIRWHHKPDTADEEFKELTYSVHLGDILAMMAGMGTGSDSLAYRIDEGYENYIKISMDDILQLFLEVQEEFITTKNALLSSSEDQSD
ncbi:MAG: HDOD domain-containing protein [FCB group bacterium]|nr:HDOD domain-containing protein [FCB group bacterium]